MTESDREKHRINSNLLMDHSQMGTVLEAGARFWYGKAVPDSP